MSNKQVTRIRQYDNKNLTVTPKQRAFMKKIGNKQLRKQHEQILKEGLLSLADDQFDQSHYVWEDDLEYEDSYAYYDYDPYWGYYPYAYDPYWGDERMTHDDITQLAQDKVIITKEDCGKTLGQIMREYLLKV